MYLISERATVGTKELLQYVTAEFLSQKKFELEEKLSTLPIDTPKILSASAMSQATGDQSHLDEAMEELASTSSATMDEIVAAVMILQTTWRLQDIEHHIQKGQRDSVGGDGPDPVEVHYETVSSDFPLLEDKQRQREVHDGEDSGEEGDVNLPVGVELIGDARFVGKDNVQRRNRCAALFCIKSSPGGSGGGGARGGAKPTRDSVAHRALVLLIEAMEVKLAAKVEEQSERMARDNLLLLHAFEREVRMQNIFDLVDPSKIFDTGDIMKVLETSDRIDAGAAITGSEGGSGSAGDFTLRLKSESDKSGDASGNLKAIVSISPNTLNRRRMGQDVEIDTLLAILVNKVPYRNIIDGFVALEGAGESGEGKGAGEAGVDLLPANWWDRKRTYNALLEEAISLDFRHTACIARTKELKKKSGNLTEAIEVVRKSAVQTGGGLREMTQERVEVDASNNQVLKASKAAVKKWTRLLEENDRSTDEAKASVKRVRAKYSRKILEEEAEAKKRADEELLRQVNSKKSSGKSKGSKKKATSPVKKAAPPPTPSRRRKEGEEEGAKTEEEMTADELGDLLKECQKSVEDLSRRAETAEANLKKFQDRVTAAENNRDNTEEIITMTISSDLQTLNQLHTAISDYKREQAKVDSEVKLKQKESKEIASQIEDVAYTARLIASEGAPPFEYKLSRGPSPTKGKGGKKGGKKKEEEGALSFQPWKPKEEEEDSTLEKTSDSSEENKEDMVGFAKEPLKKSQMVVKPEPVRAGEELIERVRGRWLAQHWYFRT